MNERYFIAISYGISWLLLGWGTYGFLRVSRWLRRRRPGNTITITGITLAEHQTRALLRMHANWRSVRGSRLTRVNQLRSRQELGINEVIRQNAEEMMREQQPYSG